MKTWLQQRQVWDSPLRVWLLVLAVVSATEAMVMVVLPSLLPEDPSLTLEATVDSVLLTVIVSPLLWWFIDRPLRATNRLRAEFLAEYFARTEVERRHIAYDLHDGVGQSLTLLVSGLKSAWPESDEPDSVKRQHLLQQLARQALTDVKRLALGLRPSLLDDFGLGPALESIVKDFSEHHQLNVSLDTTEFADRRLPEAIETAIFRIAQESLTNVAKHAQSKRVFVTLRNTAGTVELSVRDDGVGIPAHFLNGSNGRHLGLTGMRERATLLGGEMTIVSSPSQGTQLTVRVPISESLR